MTSRQSLMHSATILARKGRVESAQQALRMAEHITGPFTDALHRNFARQFEARANRIMEADL